MTKLMLVDDHMLVRQGLKLLLSNYKFLKVIHEANSADEAERMLEKQPVDLVLCDINLPGRDGFSLAASLKSKYPGLKIIILSMHISETYINKAIELEINGYLDKDIDEKILLEAIDKVMQGEVYFCNNVTNMLIRGLQRGDRDHHSKMIEDITPREKEILQMVVKGSNNKIIAQTLNISAKTVNNHKTNILKKFQLRHTSELVKFCYENDILV